MSATAPVPSSGSSKPAKGPALPSLQAVGPQKASNWRDNIGAWAISAVLHGIILGAFAFMYFDTKRIEEIFTTVASITEPEKEAISESSVEQPEEVEMNKIDTPTETTSAPEIAVDTPIDIPNINDLDPATIATDAPSNNGPAIKIGDHMGGRQSAAARAEAVRKGGGTTSSEASVLSGLKWLSNHQAADGSWNFDHTHVKGCDCQQPGSLKKCQTGATAMAMLAYMGGGHTHKKGDYQKEMKKAVDFMLKAQKLTPEGADFCPTKEANERMYVQGICTIALCEAVALTKDEKLRAPAFNAVKFIINAQDQKGGGWRYEPKQAGDTSVVGWQVMALKSAQMTKMKGLPNVAFKGAEKFLDSVADDKGAKYGYTPGPEMKPTPTLTAAGLLCRMYMGWDEKNPALKRGVEYLDKTKPSTNNMYYNYYATQVMHHWGGEEWKRWNAVMRDHLVNTQLKTGHAAGSWNLADPHGGTGGRHYMTCLAVMTLEVYYRHLPLYQRESSKVEF